MYFRKAIFLFSDNNGFKPNLVRRTKIWFRGQGVIEEPRRLLVGIEKAVAISSNKETNICRVSLLPLHEV